MNNRYLVRAVVADTPLNRKYGCVGKVVEGYLCRLSENLDPVVIEKNSSGASYKVDPASIRRCTGMYDNTKWEELPEEEKVLFLNETTVFGQKRLPKTGKVA